MTSTARPRRQVAEGELAPDFELDSQHGTRVRLSELRGRWVVVYFYPHDDTPGCTAESCSFRDAYEDFTDAGAEVLGVSGDSVASHEQFAAKHRLPFTLLADEGDAVRRAWGVKSTLGILPGRVTFVIAPDGVVRKVFSSQVRTGRHVSEALQAIRGA
ncbi:MAG: peroxiredoxin [Acidimicrobiales bacterium]|jgi:peroxiredoxin Q/BCP|nr:peroxiredoxin [Acidimicrobiales bacterium]